MGGGWDREYLGEGKRQIVQKQECGIVLRISLPFSLTRRVLNTWEKQEDKIDWGQITEE